MGGFGPPILGGIMIYAGRLIHAREDFTGTELTVATTRIPHIRLPNSYAPLRYWIQVNKRNRRGLPVRVGEVSLRAGTEATFPLDDATVYHYVPFRHHADLAYTVCTLDLIPTTLTRTRIDAVESKELSNTLYHERGKVLNLTGTRSAFLVIQPTEIVRGDGAGEFTLEHSPDQRSWEPLYHGGFPSGTLRVDQMQLDGETEVPLILTGCSTFVRWVYNPINPLAWGWRGKVGYRTVSVH